MKSIVCLICLWTCAFHAQMRNSGTLSKGFFSAYFGGASNSFLRSTITFKGSDYNFQATDVMFSQTSSDNKSPLFNQYRFGIAYMVRKKVQLSLGLENLSYHLSPQLLKLSGYVKPGFDQISGLSGDFDTQLSTDSTLFDFQVRNARLVSLTGSFFVPLYRTAKANFTVDFQVGGGAIAVFSAAKVGFGSAYQEPQLKFSGSGLVLNSGLRLTFFKHVFLKPNIGGLVLFQRQLSLDVSDISQTAQHTLGVKQASISLGTTFFPGKKNKCDCPHF